MLSRRRLLGHTATLAAMAPLAGMCNVVSPAKKRKFHIGACDWSIGKSSDPAAFELARRIGLDGLMVNMGSEKNNMHLRQKSVQQAYLDASQKTGVKISSLALGELNSVPYKSDPRTDEWV
jgi:hypothetical protein